MNNWEKNLDLLIRSRTPIIFIRSNEELRVQELLEESAKRMKPRRLVVWDYIQGLRGPINSEGVGARQPISSLQWLQKVDCNTPTTLLLKDFHRFCDDPGIARMLKNLSVDLRQTPHNIILCSGVLTKIDDLDDYFTILDLPLPSQYELKSLLQSIASISGTPLEEKVLEELTRACSGLSELKVRQVSARALTKRGQLGREDLIDVLEEKRQNIARSEVLEYCQSNAKETDIGGLDSLKNWLSQRYMAFSEEAKLFGLPTPKGVLLLGPQGTGKSLTAKAIADSWSMPLLRLDVGRLFAGLVGASEARTRETIQRAEAMSPCILWIDEIDKAFGGDSRSDGGTSQRVLASILTWMAEKKSAVFVVATANAIDKLPPELLRKGRFDEIFLLSLPNNFERLKILELHLNQRRPNANIRLETIVDRTEGFSGAELEQVIIEGMHFAFSEKRELQETDLISAASQLIPLSRTAKEQLEALKNWASSGRARPASKGIPEILDN